MIYNWTKKAIAFSEPNRQFETVMNAFIKEALKSASVETITKIETAYILNHTLPLFKEYVCGNLDKIPVEF